MKTQFTYLVEGETPEQRKQWMDAIRDLKSGEAIWQTGNGPIHKNGSPIPSTPPATSPTPQPPSKEKKEKEDLEMAKAHPDWYPDKGFILGDTLISTPVEDETKRDFADDDYGDTLKHDMRDWALAGGKGPMPEYTDTVMQRQYKNDHNQLLALNDPAYVESLKTDNGMSQEHIDELKKNTLWQINHYEKTFPKEITPFPLPEPVKESYKTLPQALAEHWTRMAYIK